MYKKKKFTTTLNEQLLKELKIYSIKHDVPVATIIEILWENNKNIEPKVYYSLKKESVKLKKTVGCLINEYWEEAHREDKCLKCLKNKEKEASSDRNIYRSEEK